MAAGILLVDVNTVSARPGGREVVRGDVTFEQRGNRLIIRASNGSIIEFEDFNISRDEIVRFIQPGSWARVLNRITGGEPTVIQGQLLANGQVYLVNPAGVVFGRDAVVDAAGIWAAAGHISNEDFINGVNRFRNLDGTVANEGAIDADAIHLVGEHVRNSGELRAPRGVITMIAGDDVIIQQHGEHVMVKVDGQRLTDRSRPVGGGAEADMTAAPGIENTGTVSARRGSVVLGAGDLYALAVRNSGDVRAPGAGGEVTVASAGGLIHNTAGGEISADRSSRRAGDVTVQGTSILNEGAITADAERGRAGNVEVVSTEHTYLASGSEVSASGGGSEADGGSVIVNSLEGVTAVVRGAEVSAHGGREGGDGGFVEVSGDRLTLSGSVNIGARGDAEPGELLIDPHNLVISDTGGGDSFLADGTISFDEPDDSTDLSVSDEALEAVTGDILLQASADLRVEQQVDLVHDNNVRLEANGHVVVNESINGANDLELIADTDHLGGGDVAINAPLSIGGNLVTEGDWTRINTGEISSGGTQEYRTPVELQTDTVLTGQSVDFWGMVDAAVPGEQWLVVNTQEETRFRGNVGARRPLEALEVNAGLDGSIDQNLVIFDGTLVHTTGDILLNRGGRDEPAEVATIVASNCAGLLMQSDDGDIKMGPNEKFTSLGDLELSAIDGRVTLGDVNVRGDFTVGSDDIRIRRREGGDILDWQGNMVDGPQTEIIATGAIDFSSTPTAIGTGDEPIFAAFGGGSQDLRESF